MGRGLVALLDFDSGEGEGSVRDVLFKRLGGGSDPCLFNGMVDLVRFGGVSSTAGCLGIDMLLNRLSRRAIVAS